MIKSFNGYNAAVCGDVTYSVSLDKNLRLMSLVGVHPIPRSHCTPATLPSA
jgi:hypothetical protein